MFLSIYLKMWRQFSGVWIFLNLQNDFFVWKSMRDEILNHHSPQNFCIMPQNRGQIEASCLELPLFGLRLRQSRSSAFETSSIKSFLTTYQYLNQYTTPSSPFHTKTNKQTTHTHKNETEQTNENKTKLNIKKNYCEIFLYKHKIFKIYKEFNFF